MLLGFELAMPTEGSAAQCALGIWVKVVVNASVQPTSREARGALKISHAGRAGQVAIQARAAIAKTCRNNLVRRVRYESAVPSGSFEFRSPLICGGWQSALLRNPNSQHSLQVRARRLRFDLRSGVGVLMETSQALKSHPKTRRTDVALYGVYEISKLLTAPGRLEVTLGKVMHLLSSFLDMRHGLIALLGNDNGPEIVVGSGWSEA